MMVPLRLDAVIDWHRSTGLLIQRGFRHGVVFLYPTLPISFKESELSAASHSGKERATTLKPVFLVF